MVTAAKQRHKSTVLKQSSLCLRVLTEGLQYFNNINFLW